VNIKHVKSREGTKSLLTYWYGGNRYRVRLKGINLTGDEEKRLANEAIAEIHRMVDEAARPQVTFKDFVPIYLKHLKIKYQPAAKRNDSALRCHLIPWFGSLTLRSIRMDHGVAYIEHRRKEGLPKELLKENVRS
jgi:hypothetical protein